MWPDRVSNPGPLTYKSGAQPTALRGPALLSRRQLLKCTEKMYISKLEKHDKSDAILLSFSILQLLYQPVNSTTLSHPGHEQEKFY